jgi:UDP-glucose 4-epimerase
MPKTRTNGGAASTGKRTLVTGYAGFIGERICRRLLDEGHTVIGADLKKAGIKGVIHRRLDITKQSHYTRLPDEIDNVIHLAGISFVPKAERDFARNYDVNFLGTYNTLKYFSQAAGSHFMFASTAKVYGRPRTPSVTEKQPPAPETSYGRAKLLAEQAIKSFSIEYPAKYSILRQFNIYGPCQSGDFFIPTVQKQLKKSDKLILGNTDVSRDFLYIDDLAEAYMAILERQSQALETYNIGSGKATPLKMIIGALSGIYSRNPRIKSAKGKVRDEERKVKASIGKIRKLGWKPKTGIIEGLEKMAYEPKNKRGGVK